MRRAARLADPIVLTWPQPHLVSGGLPRKPYQSSTSSPQPTLVHGAAPRTIAHRNSAAGKVGEIQHRQPPSIRHLANIASGTMASTSFRESMNSMGWSRRDPDIPVNTSTSQSPFLSRLQALNPFGDTGYVRLPTQQEAPGAPLPAPSRREEEEGFFAREWWLDFPWPSHAINGGDDASSCAAVVVTCSGHAPPGFLFHPRSIIFMLDE